MPLLAKTGRVYFVGKYLNQKVAVKLKIKGLAQDIFDLRYRISNKLQVLRQQPGIAWNALRKNEQFAQMYRWR